MEHDPASNRDDAIQARLKADLELVAKYIEDHPDTRQKPFRFLALEALKEAYPCDHK